MKQKLKKNNSGTWAKLALLFLWAVVIMSSCRKEMVDPADLLGKWQVVSIRENNTATVQSAEKTYVLEFKPNGSFTFQQEVNKCFGSYLVPEPGQISLLDIACTEICCDSEFAQSTTRLLSGVKTYAIKKNKLTLSSDGEIKLKRNK